MAGNDPLATELTKARTSVGGTHPDDGQAGGSGSTGQVLTKFGNEPDDYGWQDAPAATTVGGEANHQAYSSLTDGINGLDLRSFTPTDIFSTSSTIASDMDAVLETEITTAYQEYVETRLEEAGIVPVGVEFDPDTKYDYLKAASFIGDNANLAGTDVLVGPTLNPALLTEDMIIDLVGPHPNQVAQYEPTWATAAQLMAATIGTNTLRPETFAKGSNGIWDADTTPQPYSAGNLAGASGPVTVVSGHFQIGKFLVNWGYFNRTNADNFVIQVDLNSHKWKPYANAYYSVNSTCIDAMSAFGIDYVTNNSSELGSRTNSLFSFGVRDNGPTGGSFISIGEAP